MNWLNPVYNPLIVSGLIDDTDALTRWLRDSRRNWNRRWWWLGVIHWLMFSFVIACWLPEVLFVHFGIRDTVFDWLYRQQALDFLVAMVLNGAIVPPLVVCFGLTCGFLGLPGGLSRQDWLIAYDPAEIARRYEAWVRWSLGRSAWAGVAFFLTITCLNIAVMVFHGYHFHHILAYLLIELCAMGLLVELAILLHLRTGRATGAVVTAVAALVLLDVLPMFLLIQVQSLMRTSGLSWVWLCYGVYVAVSVVLLLVIFLISRVNRRRFAMIAREQ